MHCTVEHVRGMREFCGTSNSSNSHEIVCFHEEHQGSQYFFFELRGLRDLRGEYPFLVLAPPR